MKYLRESLLFVLLLAVLEISGQPTVMKGGILRDTTFNLFGTFKKEIKYRPYIHIPDTVLPEGVADSDYIGYYTPVAGHTLQLRVFRPDNDSVYPALLMVHGGGWSSGSPSMQVPMAQRIARCGYVAIPVEYRLSPEALYPAAVYDLKEAVKWVRKNARQYRVDPHRIAISGCSAGGQLATLVGTTNGRLEYENKRKRKEVSSDVQAIVNIDGSVDFTEATSARNASEQFAKGRVPASVKWLGGTLETNPANWVAASPLFQVSAHSVPICFINSSIPRFHDGRDEMRRQLDAYGIYSEVTEWDDTPHPFWLFDPWIEPTVEVAVRFLDKIFK